MPKAVLAIKQHLELIRPTAPRIRRNGPASNPPLRQSASGHPPNGICRREKLDKGQMSRLLRGAYKRHPKLDRPLRLLNLLNQQTKRREVSTARVSYLKGGDEIGRCERAEVQQDAPYAEHRAAVKLAELKQEVFRPSSRTSPSWLRSRPTSRSRSDPAGAVGDEARRPRI